MLFAHQPVLLEPVISGLQVQPTGFYLDATLGGGGHTLAILEAGAQCVISVDQDPEALSAAQVRIHQWLADSGRPDQIVKFHQGNFARWHLDPTDPSLAGILADLGVSSPQLDRPERGFSFRQEGPLDMRMDPTTDQPTAADWVNTADLEVLVDIFSRYGEERYSKRIARQIVERRPFYTTTQLAEVIQTAVPAGARQGRIHPATRVFQALRIAVNQELQCLEIFLQKAPDWLQLGGRIAIISFHSLEDRLVKWQFRQDPRLRLITRKPIQAKEEEIRLNPRSRSAKLRIAERC